MRTRYVLPLASLCIAAAPSAQENAEQLPSITVTARPLTPFQLQPEWTPLSESNTALLLRRVPGANVNFNGTLAGIDWKAKLYGTGIDHRMSNMDGFKVLNSDVAVGERIAGDGINGFVQARFTW